MATSGVGRMKLSCSLLWFFAFCCVDEQYVAGQDAASVSNDSGISKSTANTSPRHTFLAYDVCRGKEAPWVPEAACSCPALVESSALQRPPIDNMWMMVSATTILGMQVGFALLEGGYTRKMHMANIMMKNLADLVLSGVGFFCLGYRLAYKTDVDGDKDTWSISDFVGTPVNPFDGLAGGGIDPVFFFFQWSFAATASTIDSGALAERVNFFAYLMLSTWTSVITYPIAAHWVWGGGWLQQLGFVDFAGGGVVHGLGGVSALVTVAFIGPRIGRYPNYKDWQNYWIRKCLRRKVNSSYFRTPTAAHEKAFWVDLNPPGAASNPVQLLFGTLMLWVGWYGFNPSSTFAVTNNQDSRAALVAVNTTLAACCGGCVGMVWSLIKLRVMQAEVGDLCNGVLAGLVAITAPCCCVSPVGACVIGIVVPFAMFPAAKIIDTLGFDDVVGAIAVHGLCGMMGTTLLGILSVSDCIVPGGNNPVGVIYGGDAKFFGIQLLGVVSLTVWSFFTTLFALHLISLIIDCRCHRFEELVGLDYCEHNFCEDPNQRLRLQKTLQSLKLKMDEDSDSFTKEDCNDVEEQMILDHHMGGPAGSGGQQGSGKGARDLIVRPEEAQWASQKDAGKRRHTKSASAKSKKDAADADSADADSANADPVAIADPAAGIKPFMEDASLSLEEPLQATSLSADRDVAPSTARAEAAGVAATSPRLATITVTAVEPQAQQSSWVPQISGESEDRPQATPMELGGLGAAAEGPQVFSAPPPPVIDEATVTDDEETEKDSGSLVTDSDSELLEF